MKIAILQKLDFHLECAAFLLEMYNGNNIDIYINLENNKFKWIEYYSTIYNFNVIYNDFNKNILHNYDKILKLTSNDNCLDDKKIISILHLDIPKIRSCCNSEKYISLTPYINGANIYYTFPIYQPNITSGLKSKIITMIGYYSDNNIDNDLLKFINLNNNYTFNFIIWGGNGKKLKNIKNVNYYSSVKTNIMINILNNSKYVLSKKKINYDRFSGQLSLAMSHEIPLIIDIRTKTNYKLPGITFDKNYCEINNLDDITDEKYNSLKKEIKLVKDNILENNKMIFKSAF
tara:strand:+ start:347 stop:1213 length:867 start_codon:yes stop_codon:yes gene_type:complete